ncbi:CPBP family glutamic-type intramembrane protease [Paracoccus aestuariivivens]|uniref:CPBP family intramembrane metalloprotease n=1 Tax=Paracoccus aestuariivivens TaxID=1820333 RepID=A0A6L6J334_9RHOB|nr:CPBP family glutamic-type intramembrane protease [Paracoccus aestuariivivens]MTH76502.1 CPBP family intramembrane metalloprotease [Paracoccus aestuariivivens]
MDRHLARAALVAIPVLAVLFHRLALSGLRPLTACMIGLAVYWSCLMIALLWRRAWSLRPRWPGYWIGLPLMALVLFAAIASAGDLARLSSHVLAAVLICAAINGTLEEAFWRGALVPHIRSGEEAEALKAVGLFTLWHVAPAATLVALDAPGGIAGMLVGALVLGGLGMAARISSTTAGFGAICHVVLNICTFGVLAATNRTAPFP